MSIPGKTQTRQFNRTFNGPIDYTMTVQTLSLLNDLKDLASNITYAGMIVGCVETNSAYILNSTKDEWLQLASIPDTFGKNGKFLMIKEDGSGLTWEETKQIHIGTSEPTESSVELWFKALDTE
jgi:hypothetical protein